MLHRYFLPATAVVTLLILLTCWTWAGGGPVRTDHAHSIPVLMYHHFADSDSGASISASRFKEQMRWLDHQGYYTATPAELLDFLEGRLDLPPKTVVITIDDGYSSTYEVAYPVFRQYDMRASVFVIGKSRGETPGWTPHFSWEEARAMSQSGVMEIHAHTHDLHRIGERDALTLDLPEEQVLIDLLTNRVEIMDQVGTNAYAFAYPYGRYNANLIGLVKRAGFSIAFTTSEGRAKPGDDPLLVPRINVRGGMPLAEFVQLVAPDPRR